MSTDVRGPSAVLDGQDVLWARQAVRELAERLDRRDGCVPSELLTLLELLDRTGRALAVSGSRPGRPDRVTLSRPFPASSTGHLLAPGSASPATSQDVGTAEAAGILGVSRRQAQRIAAQHRAAQFGGAYQLDRESLQLLVAARSQTERTP